MGEYLKFPDGKEIKLGTLDDFRYVRRDEAQRWADRGLRTEGNTSPAEAIADPTTLWRFPFPWEDRDSVAKIHERKFGDAHRLTFRVPGLEIDHQHKTVSMSAPAGGYGVNVYVPCPYLLERIGAGQDAKRAALCSTPGEQTIYLVGERFDAEGRGRTVFGCIYCERWIALSVEDLAKLREHNPPQKKQSADDAARLLDAQILARLMPAWREQKVSA